MTSNELIEILKKVTYKPGYTFNVSKGKTPHWETILFSMSAEIPDSDDPTKMVTINSSYSFEPASMRDPEEVMYLVEATIRDFELHELYEWFKVGGIRYHQPFHG